MKANLILSNVLLGKFAVLTLLVGLVAGCNELSKDTAEPDPVGGPALVRVLTESQYRATIRDIFGEDVPVNGRFNKPIRSHGLNAVGSSEAGFSPAALEQYVISALGIAEHLVDEGRFKELVPCDLPAEGVANESCLHEFVAEIGYRLFRRPVPNEQLVRFVTQAQFAQHTLASSYAGLRYALVSMLTAPEFLLRVERVEPRPHREGLAELDAYSKAERLSFFLANTSPDQALLEAAANGDLDIPEKLSQHVERLLDAPTLDAAVRAFFSDMLGFGAFDELVKDLDLYPSYNTTVALDAQEQTLRDIVRHLIKQNGDYRDLFTLRTTELTRPLGVVYRLPVASRNGWELTKFQEPNRLGIQSHLSFLALHSHPGRSSPTLRGASIREIFLCQEVPDPPADVDFSAVQSAPTDTIKTGRDRLQVHNNEPSCSGCHKIMDPPGLVLENFDGIGQFRQTESGAVIDASGDLDGVTYQDHQGFAQALRNHREAPRCVVEKMYRYAIGRDTVWKERYYMDYLIKSFEEQGYRITELMRSIALSENFFSIANPAVAEFAGQEEESL
ncbi:MAG: DUF1588 domain-containing protein [Halieaceae bacterium]|nr:DUF1588 domain-containing protein [Halieaceae bacterium]